MKKKDLRCCGNCTNLDGFDSETCLVTDLAHYAWHCCPEWSWDEMTRYNRIPIDGDDPVLHIPEAKK
jgi:hypothetical protein